MGWAASWGASTAYTSATEEDESVGLRGCFLQNHLYKTRLKKKKGQLTELGAALICWKCVTSSVLLANCVWHSGHLKLLYCSPSAFLHGRGISACGPWGARRTVRGCDAAGADASFMGLELAEAAEPAAAVVDGEETGGEEDEKLSRPGQQQVENQERTHGSWSMAVNHTNNVPFCFTTYDQITNYFIIMLFFMYLRKKI